MWTPDDFQFDQILPHLSKQMPKKPRFTFKQFRSKNCNLWACEDDL